MALTPDVLPIVEAASACSRIDDVACRLGGCLQWIVDGRPMDFCLALGCQHHIHVVRRERCDDIRCLVHAADIAQQGLINAACQIEAEVGVLSEAHIGEVLVRQGLNDSTGHCRHTALRVVAVVEFATLPLLVFVLYVVGDDGEQFVSQVA